MPEDKILRTAEFNPDVCKYWLTSGCISLLATFVGIPLIPFWLILGHQFTKKYLERISCELNEKTLVVKKGYFNRIEKTIPLEKITDLAVVQGPIMRSFDLHGLNVETAGSSGAGASGALVGLVGIVDAIEFRDAVLQQRDRLASNLGAAPASAMPSETTSESDSSQIELLADIRDTLHRIERNQKDR